MEFIVWLAKPLVIAAIIGLILGVGAAFLTGLSRGYRLTVAADSGGGGVRSASAQRPFKFPGLAQGKPRRLPKLEAVVRG